MKTFNLNKLLAVLATTLLFSCHKDMEPSTISTSPNKKTESTQKDIEENVVTYHIYYATWDEWGRSVLDCEGMGLCNFVDCFACCTDENDVVIDCPQKTMMLRSGIIKIRDGVNSGIMTINLNPIDKEQESAINTSAVLYIDENLESATFTVLAGEYMFNPHQGSYGGYQVDVIKK